MPQQTLPLVRIRTAFQILIAVIFSCPPLIAAPGTDCVAKQQALTYAKSRVKADQNSIRKLNAGATASDLEKWANAADEERREVLKDSIVNSMGILAGGLENFTEPARDALKPTNIAGVYLPHGVGSLGTGQANLIIGRLQRLGSTSPQVQTLIDNVRVLSSFQNKTETLEFAAKVHDIASAYNESADFATNLTDATNSDPVKVAAVGLQLVSGLVGKGATISVDVGAALFTGVEHLTDAYLISSIINNLSNSVALPQPLAPSNPTYEVQESQGTVKPSHPTGKQDITEAQLAGLKVLARKLDRDVKALQDAKAAMENCQPDKLEGAWAVNGTSQDSSPTAMHETFIVTKTGPGAFELVFANNQERGCETKLHVVRTGPTTYSGSSKRGEGCLPTSMNLDVQGDNLSFTWIIAIDEPDPTYYSGSGHRVSP
jgi:hypothetical protein